MTFKVYSNAIKISLKSTWLSPKFTLTNLITAGYPNSGNTSADQKLYVFLLGKEKLRDFREHC